MKSTSSEWRRSALGASAAIGVVLAAREAIARRREADLNGQVALVTGGSRGLGLAIARELAREGCRLAICARDAAELEVAARELRTIGADVVTYVCDVGVEADVRTMVREVESHYGRIDLLFANAGIIKVGQFEGSDVEDFRQAMDVMFWGTLYPILAVVPGMRSRRYGRIAAITSIGGRISVPRLLPYSAAKFAAVGLTEGLAAELASDGIAVTTIVPGLMRTGSHVNAQFKGSDAQQQANYAWFSLGASSPVAPRADRAARIILRAVRRGEAECIFPFPFALASRFHGLAPATTVRLMRLVDAVLPGHASAPGETSVSRGTIVEERLDSSAHRVATTLGREAATAFNQHVGQPPADMPQAT